MRLIFLILAILMIYSTVHSQYDGVIVYSNYDWQLYTMSPDGSNQQEINIDFNGILNPDWSPQQQAFAVVSDQIYYVDVFRDHQFKLTKDMSPFIESTVTNINPKWSLDGNKIAYSSQYYGHSQLFIMDADGRNQEQLVESEYSDGGFGLTWVFGGTHIVFVRSMEFHFDEETQAYEVQHLYLLNIETGELTNLTKGINICPGEFYHNPVWSDTSNRLAFAMGCGGDDMLIYVVDANTPEELAAFNYSSLTEDIFEVQTGYLGIAWSPSGEKIAFVALIEDESRSSEIIVMDVEATLETGTPVYEQITDTPAGGRYRGLDWIDSTDFDN